MKYKEIRCTNPCYTSRNGKLLMRVSGNTSGIIELVCPKRRKCKVTYDADSQRLICLPKK